MACGVRLPAACVLVGCQAGLHAALQHFAAASADGVSGVARLCAGGRSPSDDDRFTNMRPIRTGLRGLGLLGEIAVGDDRHRILGGAASGPHRVPVHLDVRDLVAVIRGDGEGHIRAVLNGKRTGWVDASACPCLGMDRVRVAGLAGEHVGHVIERALILLEPVVSHQGICRLLRGHLVGSASRVAEAAILLLVAQQAGQGAHAVLGKGAVGGSVSAQGGQGHDDLGAGFGASIASGAVLGGGEEVHCLIYGALEFCVGVRRAQRLEPALVEVVGGQGLHRHGADVHTAQVASASGVHLVRVVDGPVAVGLLLVDKQVDPRRPGLVSNRIIPVVAGIQGDERPDGAVVALFGDLIGVTFTGLQQRLHQVVGDVAHPESLRILPQRGQGQDDPGVLGVQGLVS